MCDDREMEFIKRLGRYYRDRGIGFYYTFNSELCSGDSVEIVIGENWHFIIQRDALRGKIRAEDIGMLIGVC
jgi:hypothetical protein